VRRQPLRRVRPETALARLRHHVGKILVDLGQWLRIGVANDDHQQALLGGDRDSDVDALLQAQPGRLAVCCLLPLGVDVRVLAEGNGARLGDHRVVGEAGAIPLLEFRGKLGAETDGL
jgi:hypothetical protein